MTISGNTQMMYWNQRRTSLPEGYMEVEYLESTGVQWIDTGIVPDNETGAEIKFLIPPDNGTDNIVFGCKGPSNSRYWVDVDWGPTDTIQWGFNYYSYIEHRYHMHQSGIVITAGLNYKNSRCGTVNDTVYDNFGNRVLSDLLVYTCYIFCANISNNTNYHSSVKVYCMRMTHGSILVRSYIPCVRTSDSKPGMYDLCGSICPLTGTPFYINAGAGADFLWGEL